MDPVTIRLAAASDVAGLLDLYTHLNPRDPTVDSAKAAEVWTSLQASELVKVFVAEKDGVLTASCMMAIIPNRTRSARPFAVIENVVTRREFRKQGFGHAILARALEVAWDANCYKVMLATGSQRSETHRFYETSGFVMGGKTYFQANNPSA